MTYFDDYDNLIELMKQLIRPLQYPWLGSERVYWQYLFFSTVIAMLVLVRQNQCSLLRAFMNIFPKAIYAHPSARTDYYYFYINTVLSFLILVPSLAWIAPVLSAWTQDLLTRSAWSGEFGFATTTTIILYTIIQAIVVDFGVTSIHYLQHKIPILWEFHKVHHSAEVLTPITVYRMHPFDDVLALAITGGLAGIVDGVFRSIFQGNISVVSAYGINLITILFYMLGYNLRHSHVWVDYGPFWSRIFISPAQHQIHHSQDPKHHDKNMGFIFAFWDLILGTYYAPAEKEHIEFGINRQAEHKEYSSVLKLYFLPIRKAIYFMKNNLLSGLLLLGMVSLIALGLWPSRGSHSLLLATKETNTGSVYLEDLTWMEIRDLVNAGKTTAIIPTGGTEQNGPHLIVGKHHFIVHYAAGEIAKDLGNALVAPVLDYVPEGDIYPPTMHMPFAGSLTLDVPAFKLVLKSAANSLKAHGFKVICFIGDHGPNQQPQKEVADELNEAWSTAGDNSTRAVQVEQYYFNNEIKWLKDKGYTMDQIGEHAGLRDTAELLDIYPAGVRQDKLSVQTTEEQRHQTGMNGDATVATPQIGRSLIEIKIQSAIREIRQTMHHPL
jgi:creatinine amidohydrolase/Fe(II)-dependent formamide hydrolase-like protein/sterol desaturase/sphingolipid hydroxylase (fatty acid hydroxylase superfamily)